MNCFKTSLSTKSINNINILSSDVNIGESAYLVSQARLAISLSTSIMLVAGRFGLAPSANKTSASNLSLQARLTGQKTGDPAGFTFADTLAFGSMGHILGIGIYFGTVGTKML